MGIELDIHEDSGLVIAFKDNTGKIIPVQPLEEFLYGERDLSIQCMLRGKKLFDILYDDHGLIRYEDNRIALNTIISSNIEGTAMRILGKVGESVIVRRCTQYWQLNRAWMDIASGKRVHSDTAKSYVALGTGFKSTQRMYPTAYNPNDRQRDIIWINKVNQYRYQVKGSSGTEGRDAGLQIKVSTNGMKYIYRDLLTRRYEVPLVYFDLMGDYNAIYKRLREQLDWEDYRTLGEWFIEAREVDKDAYYEVEDYADIIVALIKGKIEPYELIRRAQRNPTFGTAVMAGTMEQVASEILLHASSDWDNRTPENIELL